MSGKDCARAFAFMLFPSGCYRDEHSDSHRQRERLSLAIAQITLPPVSRFRAPTPLQHKR